MNVENRAEHDVPDEFPDDTVKSPPAPRAPRFREATNLACERPTNTIRHPFVYRPQITLSKSLSVRSSFGTLRDQAHRL